VRSFGAVPLEDASEQNRRAFQTAIEAAACLRAPLYVPPGTYLVGGSADSSPLLEIPDQVVLFGDGAASTTVKFDPHGQNVGIQVHPGARVELHDLSLQGPPEPAYVPENPFHQVYALPGNDTVIAAQGCPFTGGDIAFKTNGGPYFWVSSTGSIWI
jgi:hypothetical protein